MYTSSAVLSPCLLSPGLFRHLQMPTRRNYAYTSSRGGAALSKRRASPTSKSTRSAVSKSTRSAVGSKQSWAQKNAITTFNLCFPPPPVYATKAQFEAWEETIKKHVPTFVKDKDAVREFDSLLMCIVGIPEGKRIMHVHHVGKGLEHHDERVFIRKWKPRQSTSSTVDKTKFVAFDLRGPTFYITETSKLEKTGDDGAWCKEDSGEFTITGDTFHTESQKSKKGAKKATEGIEGVASGVFASKLLARYHALCPTKANPSKDADMIEHFSKWAISLQKFVKNECEPGTKLTVRFARRPFTRATNTRTKNYRVVVPAKTIKAKCKQYYLRANRAKDSKFAKECPDCENHCLALDINDDRTVVADAHVSPNYSCAKTDFISRVV